MFLLGRNVERNSFVFLLIKLKIFIVLSKKPQLSNSLLIITFLTIGYKRTIESPKVLIDKKCSIVVINFCMQFP